MNINSFVQKPTAKVFHLTSTNKNFGVLINSVELTKTRENTVSNLVDLEFAFRHKMSTYSINDALADQKISIEDLKMDGMNPYIVRSVVKWTNIQVLAL